MSVETTINNVLDNHIERKVKANPQINKNMDKNMNKTSRQDSKKELLDIQKESIMKRLSKFYQNQINLEIFLNIVLKKSKISLRVLDWFVTRYSLDHDVKYLIKKHDRTRIFCVYQSYQAELIGYRKKLFDPFSRKDRIRLTYVDPEDNENKSVATTPGQLNFFSWAIENSIIDYVEQNYDQIKEHMKQCNKESKDAKKKGIKVNGKINRGANSTIIATLDFVSSSYDSMNESQSS